MPKTRAKATAILGITSVSGVIKCSLRLPQVSSKKRKREDHSETTSRGIVTGHYLGFLKATIDKLNISEQMKSHYLVKDNAPIHRVKEITSIILNFEDIDASISYHTCLDSVLLRSFYQLLKKQN
jgi:hypothetical protein